MSNIKYWSGDKLENLEPEEVFVAGTNPQGRHGKGAAAAAVKLGGAIYGKASGMIGPQAYGIITKSLKAGFTDKNGFTYHLEGERSISPEEIKKEIDILYQNAMQPEHQNKHFIISYQYETYHNGTPKKSLNGYTSQEMLEMFVRDNIPPNIVFHESYKPHLEKILAKEKDQHSPSLINYRNYEFISVEQFIMFSKAKTFKDEELANKIINLEQTLSNNRAARDLIIGFKNSSITRDNILAENADIWETIHHTLEELGKNVANYDESVWAVRKIPVTSIANREKYSQNPHIKITNTATQENNLPIQSSIKRSL